MTTIQLVIIATATFIIGFLAALGADRLGRELATIWYESKRKRGAK